jgi:hopanoid biosynthesis associated protein HpnK
MVGASAAPDAVARARRLKGLAVGLHVTLADGRPVLPPARIPSLVDVTGRFRDDLFRSGLRWFLIPAVRRQLAAEIRAQFSAFISTGLVLDHANAHKHLHLHPTVGGMIVQIGRGYGLRALRIPTEPPSIIARASGAKSFGARARVRPLSSLLRSRARTAGLIVNNRIFGLDWSGAMTEERLLSLIPHLPEGISELYMHPAAADAASMPHAVPHYRYREELDALTSPAIRDALERAGIVLATYSGVVHELMRVAAAHRAEPA